LTAYPDSSFLGSLYGRDANSLTAVEQYRRARPLLLLTAFGEFEVINAFESLLFRAEARPMEVQAALRALEDDIQAGAIARHPIPETAYARALELSHRHTRQLDSRALDILHVAIALELRADAFFTFDRRQHRLARRAGLRVRPGHL
jgi:predicted nucleic acid-binding protein